MPVCVEGTGTGVDVATKSNKLVEVVVYLRLEIIARLATYGVWLGVHMISVRVAGTVLHPHRGFIMCSPSCGIVEVDIGV